MNKTLSVKWLFIIAIVIRLFIAPFFYHPDIKTYNYQASFLKQGVFDIYSYLALHKHQLPLKEEFVYFPVTYFVLGGWQFLMQPFFGSEFDSWLGNAGQSFLDQSGTYRYLFLLKVPYLIVDLLIAFVLFALVKDKIQKRKVLLFWLFNPLSILLLYVYSNVDIYPVLFILLTLLFFKKERFILSALFLGIAAAFKAFPLLLVPFIVPFIPQMKNKILFAVISLGVFILSIAPFLPSEAFRNATLVSGLTTRIFFNNIHIGFGEYLMVPIILLSALFYITLQFKQYLFEKLVVVSFLVFLFIFASIHFHIQWLLWIVPLAGLVLAYYRRFDFLVWGLFICAVFLTFLYPDLAVTFGIYSGISSMFLLLPTPFTIMEKVYDPFVIQSVLHSALLGGSVVLGLELLRKEVDHE